MRRQGRAGGHPACIGNLHTWPRRRRQPVSVGTAVPSANRPAQPQDAVARVVGLLRLERLRRRPRHRVQRDPRGGRADRRLAPLQVPGVRAGRARGWSTGSSPATPRSCGRRRRLHAVVRRARQGRRRRDRPPPRRAAAIAGPRPTRSSAGSARTAPGSTSRSPTRPRRPPRSRSRDRCHATSWKPRPASRSPTSRYFRRRAARIGKVAVDVSRTGYTGDLGYELWIPAAKAR